jgi:hypothetical protein
MTIQIDRFDTSVEITPPHGDSGGRSADRGSMSPRDPQAQAALTDVIGRLMADELERFMRNRGH